MKKKNKLKYIYLMSMSYLMVVISNISATNANGKVEGTGKKFIVAFNDLSKFAKKLTAGMLAFASLSAIAVILYHIVQLALAGGNPNERSRVLKNLLSSAICIALLGSIGFIMSFIMFYTGV